MRFKTIFLIVALAMFMLAGVTFAKEEEDKYAQAIEALEAEIAALQAQNAALTADMGAVQTQADEIETEVANFRCKCPAVPYSQIDANKTNIAANTADIAANTTDIATNTEAINYLNDITDNRFTDMGDGTIRDNDSKLFWLKDANCQELLYYNPEGSSWNEAVDSAMNLADGTCGLTDGSMAGDWRLPTYQEWENFMSEEFAPPGPALANTIGDGPWQEGDAFTGVLADIYWVGNENFGSVFRFVVDMGRGGISQMEMYHRAHIWPVRSKLQ